jgi:hypothetical protein
LSEEEQAKNRNKIDIDVDLERTSQLLKDFNQFVIDVQNSLNSTKKANADATLFDADTFGIESNLGKNFYELAVINKKLKQVG